MLDDLTKAGLRQADEVPGRPCIDICPSTPVAPTRPSRNAS
ncbi:hypothetical protein L842_3009 [Mycobacterium intracellulare MIN_052511_1280]|nr:hypothetical protein L842_3009 [Mycobacterium intracellulare MIN_052511_1280]